ncbi:Npun_R2821/Npun_R2822 family protein [Capilliphycus salinus ALCB114379]|uniref:Npun_R2821/Npun_R2822 family protein n=1 Tax=Capilliphycus salinus TaxID=2768948 RepID=UPI0039A5D84A
MTEGIYTLANDVVYDQFVALLNSIEANAGREIPVCVIPYNDQLDRVKAEIANRKNVKLFDDVAVINDWENFVSEAWKAHRRAQEVWKQRELPSVYRLAMHRKLCGINGEFDKFVYFDADTLLMSPLDAVYEKLDEYDWVANDFQYKSDLKYIFDRPQEQLLRVFEAEKLPSHIFCAGWFASKKGVLNSEILDDLLRKLKAGEADVMALFGAGSVFV